MCPVSRRSNSTAPTAAPYWRSECGRATIYLGDCREILPHLEPDQFHAVVTDPPYELGFMSKRWDGTGVAYDVKTWDAALQVAKSGAHLLSFGGSRTYHRMTCAIEDAEWEIRDCLMWVYGSGYPKSMDVSKAIDKKLGAKRRQVRTPMSPNGNVMMDGIGSKRPWKELAKEVGYHEHDSDDPVTEEAKRWHGWGTCIKPSYEPCILAQKPLSPEQEQRIIVENLSRLEAQLWSLLPASAAKECFGLNQNEYDAVCASAQWSVGERLRQADSFAQTDTSLFESAVSTCLSTVISWRNTLGARSALTSTSITRTKSNTTIDWRTLRLCSSALTLHTIIQDAISQPGSWWSASGAAEVLSVVVQSLNSTLDLSALVSAIDKGHISLPEEGGPEIRPAYEPIVLARKPLGGTVAECVMANGTGALNVDACKVGTTGTDITKEVPSKEGSGSGIYRFNSDNLSSHMSNGGFVKTTKDGRWPANLIHDGSDEVVRLLPDGADRYFYTPKADEDDRPHGKNATIHPTVKPLDLMRYLVRLVCVRGGTVLDPFCGSGSTGVAAVLEGMQFVGVELSKEYADIAVGKIRLALESAPSLPTLNVTSPAARPAVAPSRPEVKRLRGT